MPSYNYCGCGFISFCFAPLFLNLQLPALYNLAVKSRVILLLLFSCSGRNNVYTAIHYSASHALWQSSAVYLKIEYQASSLKQNWNCFCSEDHYMNWSWCWSVLVTDLGLIPLTNSFIPRPSWKPKRFCALVWVTFLVNIANCAVSHCNCNVWRDAGMLVEGWI